MRLAVYLTIFAITGFVVLCDNKAPVLEQTYVFTVAENLPVGTHLGRITAKDSDGPQALTFSIADPGTRNIISLSSPVGGSTTGRSVDMVSKISFDREAQTKYLIPLTVSDGDNTVKFNVTIFLSDVNDNAPVFLMPSYSGTVPSAALPGSRVLTVFATDFDSGSGGVIRYTLKSDTLSDMNYFYINVYAGLIETKAPLLLQADHTFHFQVVAQDGGNLSSEVNVTIYVTPPAVPTLHPIIQVTPFVG